MGPDLERLRNLTVVSLPPEAVMELAGLAQRTMTLQCTIQDGQVWVTGGNRTVPIELRALMLPAL